MYCAEAMSTNHPYIKDFSYNSKIKLVNMAQSKFVYVLSKQSKTLHITHIENILGLKATSVSFYFMVQQFSIKD